MHFWPRCKKKGLKSNGTSNIAEVFAKKPILEAWGRLKRPRSCERFFVDISLEQADLYSLVFFLDTQTFYQVLFAQVYSVRLTPIYLFLAIRQFCKYDKDSCIKSEKFLSQHLHIRLFRLVMSHGLTVALFLHYSCGFSRVPPLHCSIQFLFVV